MKIDVIDIISTADKKREIAATTEMSEVSVGGGILSNSVYVLQIITISIY